MILIREARVSDLDAFERLGQVMGMFNLAGDRDQIQERIERSERSFQKKNKKFSDGKYIFVAEDLSDGEVVGTSLIASQHGTPDLPHFYFEVGSEEKYSKAINTGFIHGTLSLKYNTDGPSEIGGLTVDGKYRNHPKKVGRQISFCRFLYMGLNRSLFKNQVLAELLPPLNKKGQSPLWEAIGRRFTNMDYLEADLLCSKNKDFILSLFPSEKIYTTFLSAEARNAIGKVGKDTEPVFHMLKKVGFNYAHHVDPFDGGPHLVAETDRILPIQNIQTIEIKFGASADDSKKSVSGLISPQMESGLYQDGFKAMDVDLIAVGGNIYTLRSPGNENIIRKNLGNGLEGKFNFMPYYPSEG